MTETKNMLLFRKWDTSGIEIIDPGLTSKFGMGLGRTLKL